MAWLNASGNPIATKPVTIQIDVPSEAVGDTGITFGAVNWAAVLGAGIQLVLAMMTGNSAAIAAAIQQLLNAFMGG
jgi:hypothetical protein